MIELVLAVRYYLENKFYGLRCIYLCINKHTHGKAVSMRIESN
jgi:hypothetical protein